MSDAPLEFDHAGSQLGEQFALNFELFARDQIEALERLVHERTNVSFQIGSGAGAQQLAHPSLQIIEYRLSFGGHDVLRWALNTGLETRIEHALWICEIESSTRLFRQIPLDISPLDHPLGMRRKSHRIDAVPQNASSWCGKVVSDLKLKAVIAPLWVVFVHGMRNARDGTRRPLRNQESCSMRKTYLATALLSCLALSTPSLSSAQAKKEEPKPAWSSTGNLNFVSEYRYRGINQTNSKPAIQGGFDFSHVEGWYVGTWASNVNWLSDLGVSNSLEWDFYGGYKGTVAGLPYDVGALYYWYPGKYPGSFTNPNTFEIYGALTWTQFTFKYSHALTDTFGFADSKSSGYLDVTGNFELGGGLNLVGHIGHQIIAASSGNSRSRSDCSYTDWKLGLTTEAVGYVWGVAYVDTNAKGGTGQCYRSVYDKSLGKSTLVLSVTKNF
jgi:uncharacterized protein (TIGR02001 family)